MAGYFETKAGALAAIRDAVTTRGREYAEQFLLLREDTKGRTGTVAEGSDLVDLALRSILLQTVPVAEEPPPGEVMRLAHALDSRAAPDMLHVVSSRGGCSGRSLPS